MERDRSGGQGNHNRYQQKQKQKSWVGGVEGGGGGDTLTAIANLGREV